MRRSGVLGNIGLNSEFMGWVQMSHSIKAEDGKPEVFQTFALHIQIIYLSAIYYLSIIYISMYLSFIYLFLYHLSSINLAIHLSFSASGITLCAGIPQSTFSQYILQYNTNQESKDYFMIFSTTSLIWMYSNLLSHSLLMAI